MKKLLDLLVREPVLAGGAVLGWIAVLHPSQIVMAATVSTVTWIQRLASKSKKTAAEDVEVARYVGALEGPGSAAPVAPPAAGDVPGGQ